MPLVDGGHRSALFVTLLVAVALASLVAATRAAATTYRPSHTIHFDAGTYTGYKFDASGGTVASRSATLSRASTAGASLRTVIANRSGEWLAIVNGIWAGYVIHESSHAYLPYTRLRTVRFAAGTYTGYRFNASDAVVAHKTAALARPSAASASALAHIGSRDYLLIVNGIWAGWWVPAGSGAGLRYPPLGANRLTIQTVVGGLAAPLFVTNARDGSSRLFVIERAGRVRVVSGGTLQPAAFLDIAARVSCCNGEQGLLGLAFHPSFASNHRLFVDYADLSGNIVIAEYTANAGNTSASASTERVLLKIPHPTYTNHYGGWLGFGPDGYLYIATGDGGGGGDPGNHAQNVFSLLGKMLRIDVNGGTPYRIPASNPFVNGGGAPEVWDYGLRNPWRDSFDRERGDLFIGDVGQALYEEVDRQAPGAGRQNFGWRVMEGFSCYGATSCAQAGKTLPVAAYSHGTNGSIGCAITGGYLYRGTAQPALVGQYILGDYCSGRLWTLYQDENVADLVAQADLSVNISSFGESENGEVYLTDLAGGVLYRVVVH